MLYLDKKMKNIIKIIYLKIRLFLLKDTLKNAVYLNLTKKEEDEEKQRRLILEIMNIERRLTRSLNKV